MPLTITDEELQAADVIAEEYWQQELTSLKWLSEQNAANEKLGNLRRRDNVRCDSPL